MPDFDDQNIALSGVLAEIAEIAGTAVALQVANAKGGQECVYIPRPDSLDKGAGRWLVEAVGREAAQHIAADMGGQSYAIPLGPMGGTLNRARRAVATALQAGTSAAKAARLSGLHERTARRVKARIETPLPDLFERKV